MNIGLIGCGRLGLSFALLCDKAGYKVHCFDIDQQRMSDIMDRTLKTPEPEIEELLKEHNLVNCSSVTEVVDSCDISFVLVATPSLESGEYDHSAIDDIVKKLKNINLSGKTLTIVATCMPDYCQAIQDANPHLNITYQPSLIAQGSICNDIRNADLVLLGGNCIPEAMYGLYKNIMDREPNFRKMSLTAAGITKIAINCALTNKISYANRIGEICINSGIEEEMETVLETIGSDSRIGSKCLRYGYGFSGVCLPRDNKALGIHASNVGITSEYQEIIDKTNNEHLYYLYNYFVKLNPNKLIPFTFYQLSYKKGVDILTNSQPLSLCHLLLENGYRVNIIESENVVEQVKPLLEVFGDRVTYNNHYKGLEIILN